MRQLIPFLALMGCSITFSTGSKAKPMMLSRRDLIEQRIQKRKMGEIHRRKAADKTIDGKRFKAMQKTGNNKKGVFKNANTDDDSIGNDTIEQASEGSLMNLCRMQQAAFDANKDSKISQDEYASFVNAFICNHGACSGRGRPANIPFSSLSAGLQFLFVEPICPTDEMELWECLQDLNDTDQDFFYEEDVDELCFSLVPFLVVTGMISVDETQWPSTTESPTMAPSIVEKPETSKPTLAVTPPTQKVSRRTPAPTIPFVESRPVETPSPTRIHPPEQSSKETNSNQQHHHQVSPTQLEQQVPENSLPTKDIVDEPVVQHEKDDVSEATPSPPTITATDASIPSSNGESQSENTLPDQAKGIQNGKRNIKAVTSGAMAAIIVGIVILVLLSGAAVFLYCTKRKKDIGYYGEPVLDNDGSIITDEVNFGSGGQLYTGRFPEPKLLEEKVAKPTHASSASKRSSRYSTPQYGAILQPPSIDPASTGESREQQSYKNEDDCLPVTKDATGILTTESADEVAEGNASTRSEVVDTLDQAGSGSELINNVKYAVDNADWQEVYNLASTLAELAANGRSDAQVAPTTTTADENFILNNARSQLCSDDQSRAANLDGSIAQSDWITVAAKAAIYIALEKSTKPVPSSISFTEPFGSAESDSTIHEQDTATSLTASCSAGATKVTGSRLLPDPPGSGSFDGVDCQHNQHLTSSQPHCGGNDQADGVPTSGTAASTPTTTTKTTIASTPQRGKNGGSSPEKVPSDSPNTNSVYTTTYSTYTTPPRKKQGGEASDDSPNPLELFETPPRKTNDECPEKEKLSPDSNSVYTS